MDEKPKSSSSAVAAIDPKTLSVANEALRCFRAIEPTMPSVASQAVAETLTHVNPGNLVAPEVMRAAASAFDSSRLVNTTALSRALTEFNKANARRLSETLMGINKVNARRLSEILAEMNKATSLRVADMLKSVALTAPVRMRIAETLRTLDLAPSFRSQVVEALAHRPSPLVSDLGSRCEQAVGEAAVLADTPAVQERADESLLNLEDLSPDSRRELKSDIANAIALLLALVAILTEDKRLDLAAVCLSLAAVLVSIYWRVTGKLD